MTTEMRSRAIAVARDVIAQLNKTSGGYTPSTGTYLFSEYTLDTSKEAGDLQEHLPALQEIGCTVCALGAALLSKARLYDAVPVTTLRLGGDGAFSDSLYANRQVCAENLADVFSEDQITLIESAFECSDMRRKPEDCEWREWMERSIPRDIAAAIAFGQKFRSHRQRMMGIMENIINNGGKFVPFASGDGSTW